MRATVLLRRAARLQGAIETIDDAIAQIRTIIFAISPREREGSLRHRILDLVADGSSSLALPVPVSFAGPVDLVLGGPIGEDVEAVVRELLTNAVRHSGADHIRVSVAVDAASVRVRVEDDGVGIPEHAAAAGSTICGRVPNAAKATSGSTPTRAPP